MNESMSTEPSAVCSESQSVFELPVMNKPHQAVNDSAIMLPSFNIDELSPESERIAEIRQENLRLRQQIQYLKTYNNSLKGLIEHEYSTPSAKRTLLAKLVEEYGLSRRHVCRLLNLARSTCWYRSTAKSNRNGNLKVVPSMQSESCFTEEAI